jgi:hypothetical protein
MTTPRICAPALLALLGACEENTTEPDQAVEACEHLKEPATMVSGTSVPAVELTTAKRFEVTLLDAGLGGKTGAVRFQVPASGDLLVFLTADIPVRVSGPNGAELMVPIKKTGPCNELKAWYEYETIPGSHGIALGGTATAANSVGLVIETEEHAR